MVRLLPLWLHLLVFAVVSVTTVQLSGAFSAPTSTTRAGCGRRTTKTAPLSASEDPKTAEVASEADESIGGGGGEEERYDDDDDDDGLTAQERVLRSLGMEPESEEERSARASARLAAEEDARRKKRANSAVAVLAFAAAVLNYGWKLTHPVTAVEVLAEMQRQSDPLTVIGRNGRPTVVDFWAPWCDNCKYSAPTLRSVEKEYGERVNFVMVNGDDPDAWPIIERFGVDAIPHLAMISRDGDVETALIGPVPRSVLRADIDALLEREEGGRQPDISVNSDSAEVQGGVPPVAADDGRDSKTPLPYVMYDAFRGRPESRRVQF